MRSDWSLLQTAAAELSDASAATAAGAMLAHASKGDQTQHPTFKITAPENHKTGAGANLHWHGRSIASPKLLQ